MVQDAKTKVFFNFARILSFNRMQSYDLTRAMVLSLTPIEYHAWFDFDFRQVKSMPGAMKNLLELFKEYFCDYLQVDSS